jgi:peptidoglycan/xylan/chitin deacetylase (PgdA/CDA1 family)
LGPTLRRGARNALVLAGGAVASIGGPRLGRRALAFHEVPDIRRFEEVLDRLLVEYEIVGLEDWLSGALRERTRLTLTFDDGYASWHEAVAPVLAERKLPAVFFVTSGLVGLTGEEAREFGRNRLRRSQHLRFIGRAELEDLARHPLFEVGGHTRNHVDLGRVPDRDEVAEDRATLEDWVGAAVRWFAYPFGTPGSVSPAARAVVEQAGVSAAFTLIPGWWEPSGGDRFAIGRDGLDPSLPFRFWQAWLRGGYDRLYRLKHAIGR